MVFIPRLWILIIRMYLLDCKDVSFGVQEYIFRGSRIYLLELKNISFGVQEHIFWGSSKYRLGYKHISFGVQGSIFLNVVTRLSRRAEPSRQVCWLQSARLLSLVASPFKRTTIYLLVVRLYMTFSSFPLLLSCPIINQFLKGW